MKTVKVILAAIATASLLGACASKIAKSEIDPSADPAAEIARLDQALADDMKNHVNILAPEDYTKVGDYVGKAKKDLAAKEKQSQVIEDIAYATSYEKRASALSRDRQGAIQGVLTARTAALNADVLKYPNEKKQLAKLDGEIARASDNLGKNLSPDDVARLQREYMELETLSISDRELGEPRAKIAAAIEGDAKKRAPNTLNQAQLDLRNAENVLKQNIKDQSSYRPAVNQSKASALFLTAVMGQIAKNGKNTSESVAVQLAEKNQSLASLKSQLDSSEGTVDQLTDKVSEQNQSVSLQKALEDARQKFTKDEAEVFQQGNQLVIRLKTMNFPVGRAELPQQSLDILSKVNETVASLHTTKIVIEGHTDSTGGAAVNQKVSQARAETVAKYLETNGVSEDEVTAVGYGYKKPLASNKSKEGRAQNRRVDVIVTVASGAQKTAGKNAEL